MLLNGIQSCRRFLDEFEILCFPCTENQWKIKDKLYVLLLKEAEHVLQVTVLMK